MIAARHFRLDAVQFMQPLKGGAVEDPCVDGAPANAQQRVGDDIGAGIRIVGRVVAIALHVHIIDQSLV